MSIASNGLNVETFVFNFSNAYVEGTLDLNYLEFQEKNLKTSSKIENEKFRIS